MVVLRFQKDNLAFGVIPVFGKDLAEGIVYQTVSLEKALVKKMAGQFSVGAGLPLGFLFLLELSVFVVGE